MPVSSFFLLFCPCSPIGLEAAGELSELQENGREGYFFISSPGVFVRDGSPSVNEGEKVSQVWTAETCTGEQVIFISVKLNP